jgi:hypothetical protein
VVVRSGVTPSLDHLYFTETRACMAVVRGAAMAIVMLGFMWGMYENRAANPLLARPRSQSHCGSSAAR